MMENFGLEDNEEIAEEQILIFSSECDFVDPIVIPKYGNMEIDEEFANTKLDQLVEELFEKSFEGNTVNLEKKETKKHNSLFAPFNHHINRDPDLVQMESKQSASNQAALGKLFNQRYKLIMENSARYKEKEQRDKERRMKLIQSFNLVDSENVLKAFQLLNDVDTDSVFTDQELSDKISSDLGIIETLTERFKQTAAIAEKQMKNKEHCGEKEATFNQIP